MRLPALAIAALPGSIWPQRGIDAARVAGGRGMISNDLTDFAP